MRKLKTSLKPTVKTTDVLDVKMENLLSKNPVVTVLYTRNDNRYLVCKSASTFKLGFPVIKPIIVNFAVQTGKSTSKDIANQVIDTMRKEFGLDPEILNYYEGTKRPYVYQNEYLKGNDIAFDTRDAGLYVGKPEIVKNPSGEYTDERWLTLSEINDLMNQGLFDENSSYYATRCSEAKRKRAVLDPRLSLHVYADKDGVHFNNNSKDQMPLKTLNGNGLQKLEETEDYCIYICKDAIMTTVEKYAPGAYQKFQETQALINSNDGLLKEYSIDWVNKDDADLFIQINNDEVAKIESQPMMLPVEGEEPTQPIILEPKTVPTTYECCFRVDLKDGSIYIGEGYENLAKFKDRKNYSYITSTYDTNVLQSLNFVQYGQISYSFFVDIKKIGNTTASISLNGGVGKKNYKEIKKDLWFYSYTEGVVADQRILFFDSDSKENDNSIEIYNVQITKTSTPKPFVKSIMPSGKLAFITNATSETHSFVMKGIKSGLSTSDSIKSIYVMYNNTSGGGKTANYWRKRGVENIFEGDMVSSSLYNNSFEIVKGDEIPNGVYIGASWTSSSTQSFSQLLIYKGNFTRAELEGELAKLDDQGFSYKKTENTWSISTRMWIDQYGLKKYDNPRDPFPFKTINNSGIKIMEETEDYQIWIDKDAVMTTVEKYVSGSYQTFLEIKANIEGSVELLSLHEIEWTAQDDAKLFEDINNEALAKLDQSVMTLSVDGENEIQPIILEPKTVPTTYECCFRVDKKEKNFYIGEGYENFSRDRNYFAQSNYTIKQNEFMYEINKNSSSQEGFLQGQFIGNTDLFSINFKVIENTLYTYTGAIYTTARNWGERNEIKDTSRLETVGTTTYPLAIKDNNTVGKKGGTKFMFQITKTSTPKPFVKSMMPSGKLAFITNATSETHSFVMKGIEKGEHLNLHENDTSRVISFSSSVGERLVLHYDLFEKGKNNILFSHDYKKMLPKGGPIEVYSKGANLDGILAMGIKNKKGYQPESFAQLLFYKGNLTEAELKAENEKYN